MRPPACCVATSGTRTATRPSRTDVAGAAAVAPNTADGGCPGRASTDGRGPPRPRSKHACSLAGGRPGPCPRRVTLRRPASCRLRPVAPAAAAPLPAPPSPLPVPRFPPSSVPVVPARPAPPPLRRLLSAAPSPPLLRRRSVVSGGRPRTGGRLVAGLSGSGPGAGPRALRCTGEQPDAAGWRGRSARGRRGSCPGSAGPGGPRGAGVVAGAGRAPDPVRGRRPGTARGDRRGVRAQRGRRPVETARGPEGRGRPAVRGEGPAARGGRPSRSGGRVRRGC